MGIVAPTDDSRAKGLIALSNAADGTFVQLWADPVTHRLLVDLSNASGGTVTSVSVVSANGLAGTVATATTTPAITLSTTITGILQGNGTAISAATTTGSGSVVLATAPTITGATLTTSTINGNTITTGTGTLTIAAGKTLTANNSIALTGTDATTMTFPTTSATIARTDAANTFTGVQTFSTPIAATSVATMTATVGGGVPTPPNNTTTFLRGDGTFAAPASGGISWTEVTSTSQTAAVNNGYLTNNAGLVTVTLPTTAAVGSVVEVAGSGAGGWKIAQNASGQINFGNQATTSGTGGSLASVNRYDAVRLICITANNIWSVISSQGNITIV